MASLLIYTLTREFTVVSLAPSYMRSATGAK